MGHSKDVLSSQKSLWELSDVKTESRKFDPQWPVATSKLFKEAYPACGAEISDCSEERLYRMVTGYRDAADLLVAEGDTYSHVHDKVVYPIVFLYRQAIELHLKYMLMAYGPKTGVAPNFRSHNLTDLWSNYMQMIDALMPDLIAEDRLVFHEIGQHVAEFGIVDPRSDALRFAHDTQGNLINIAVDVIDLPNLRSVIAGIFDFLECVDWSLRNDYGLTQSRF